MNPDLIFMCLTQDFKNYDKLEEMQKVEVQLFIFIIGIINAQFKWKGLPKEIKPYQMEKVLNFYGQGVLFKYGDDYLITNAVNSAELNIYGEPCEVTPIAINGMSFPRVYVNTTIDPVNKKINEKNAVLIKNNLTSTPTYAFIKPFVDHLIFIWQSKGINAGLSRIKAILHSNKNLASTLKTQIKSVVGSSSMIPVVSDKTNILKEIEKLDFNVEYEPEKYWEDFDKTLATIFSMLGITTNLSQNKKERLIVSEVESNDELTTIAEDTRLDFRKLGCEDANEFFGLNMSCDNKMPEVKVTDPSEQDEPNPDGPSEE